MKKAIIIIPTYNEKENIERTIKALFEIFKQIKFWDMSILVVDDTPEDMRLVKAILQSEGFSVLEASDGVKGVAKAIQNHPDLLILDLLMPGMSGFDVVRALQQHPEARDIPIIVCTAKELTPEDREMLNSKVKSVVEKGEDAKAHLLEAVRRIERFRTD